LIRSSSTTIPSVQRAAKGLPTILPGASDADLQLTSLLLVV
jgi:hypothetical protein